MARKKARADGTAVFLAVVVVAALVSAGRFAGEHPVASALVLVLPAGVAVSAAVLRHRARKRAHLLEVARSREIARYHAMAPAEFEAALAFLCTRDGCTEARVTGRAGDLGADVIAFAPDGRKVVLQAKRYGATSKVTGPDLQRFGGTCFSVHGAGVAAVVTTSVFTKQAREYAAHQGIRLFDAHGLAAWADRSGPAPWH